MAAIENIMRATPFEMSVPCRYKLTKMAVRTILTKLNIFGRDFMAGRYAPLKRVK
jgi:hypothetical protein